MNPTFSMVFLILFPKRMDMFEDMRTATINSFNVTENESEKLLKAYLRRAKERSEAKKRDKLVPNRPEFKVL
ncbi:hypothetical protein NQ317_016525 [Molorchus minor]|uniref:Uncharacterized protein n=1 Tax=Molorchus minor TaxID=1323400 RepID=A0ABQ9IQ07_9CUCU|nr:hypothetical protein NQ317_016525 [Molorchus minor]